MSQTSVALLTNIASHYQLALGEALDRRSGNAFRLVCYEPVKAWKSPLNWKDESAELPWVIRAWESRSGRARALECVRNCDAVIWGHVPVSMIRKRVMDGQLTFQYTERIFKGGFLVPFLRGLPYYHRELWPLNRENHHLLAAGAYCAWDMRRIGMYSGRMWRWGYFPSISETMLRERGNRAPEILWAGRMLGWKRVDLLLDAARTLRNAGYAFSLRLIGDGPEKSRLLRQCRKAGLEGIVRFQPPQSPEEVRTAMSGVDIYVLPSDYREGWGAVVNEAMAEGCCVVSSRGAGSAPWLIDHGKNGYLFRSGDRRELESILAALLDRPEECRKVGREAAETVRTLWSPDVAADRLMTLIEGLLGKRPVPEFGEGPCGRAEVYRG